MAYIWLGCSFYLCNSGQGVTTCLFVLAAVLYLLAACEIAILSHMISLWASSVYSTMFLPCFLPTSYSSTQPCDYPHILVPWSKSQCGRCGSCYLTPIFMAVLERGRSRSPEDTKLLIIFLWLDFLLWTGYQRILTATDLKLIHHSLYTAQLDIQFSRILTRRSSLFSTL